MGAIDEVKLEVGGGLAGTYNVSQTCRFFGISRTQFYTAMIRI